MYSSVQIDCALSLLQGHSAKFKQILRNHTIEGTVTDCDGVGRLETYVNKLKIKLNNIFKAENYQDLVWNKISIWTVSTIYFLGTYFREITSTDFLELLPVPHPGHVSLLAMDAVPACKSSRYVWIFLAETLTWTSVHDGHGRCFLGKAPEFFLLSYEASKLSLRYSFGGGARDRDRPVSAQTFTGRTTSKCLNLYVFQRTDRNFYKLVHGERTHEPSHRDIIVAFCNFGSFSCNRDAKWKEHASHYVIIQYLKINSAMASHEDCTHATKWSQKRILKSNFLKARQCFQTKVLEFCKQGKYTSKYQSYY